MKKICLLILIGLNLTKFQLFAQGLSWEEIGGPNHDFQAVLVDPVDNNMVLAGISGHLIKSQDAGKSWRVVLNLSGGSKKINHLSVDKSANILYAATDNGLYRSSDAKHWKRVFRANTARENQCTWMLITKYAVFLGTQSGLFVSKDDCRNWQRTEGVIGKTAISNIEISPDGQTLYLSSANGFFKAPQPGDNWEKIFSINSKEQDCSVTEEDQANFPKNNFIKPSANALYVSSERGIYKSQDQGKSWERLSEFGLLSRNVFMLCLSAEGQLFALSRSGAYCYQDLRWSELTFSLSAGRLNYLAIDSRSNIYICAEKGLYKTSPKSLPFLNSSGIKQYLKSEPNINRIQEVAMRYAEVNPEKIANWRKSAAKKALLPQVNIGLDNNSTDLWHWETGSTTKNEDDVLRRGKRSLDWDISFSWNFGELIWNDAQTSIDTRSKLMVELRNDILDQVNKLYFERLRLKLEIDKLAIEDQGKRLDKQLKVEEITASLDALTGGYFSEQLRGFSPQ